MKRATGLGMANMTDMSPLRGSGAAEGRAGAGEPTCQLEHWEYGDPQKVAERRQAKSCHGCVHEAALYFAENSLSWEIVKYCGKGRRYGKQCGLYRSKRSRK
jgi:hypothetical protein